jgi:hypothetical protein
MTKATELAMLKLRIKLDIGILRWFSNLAKNSSSFAFFPKPTSHRLENQSLNMIFCACELIKKTRSYPEFGQSIHHFDTQ